MAAAASPLRATIFVYQVGFGDCFLLRLDYQKGKSRHVLIDFGTTGLPKEAAAKWLKTVADDIADKCGGALDAVVATHRHADHISGFATNARGDAPGDVIRALKPKVVVQPWTEEPGLATNATAPKHEKSYGLALQRMNGIAERVVEQLRATPKAFDNVAGQLRFIGEDNIANLSAIKNLQTMAAKNVYTFHGQASGLERLLPGVKVHVLGPPTLKQTDAIRKQRARDPDEFWQLQFKALSAGPEFADRPEMLFPGHATDSGGKLPRGARWLADRLKSARGEQMLQLVRMLDQQMNNTSLILLFEAGKKKLLFPGDAQLENWQYALSKDWALKLLADVDVYKVGHHGSLNATPKSMWKAFGKRGKSSRPDRLTTVLSTMEGKHGSADAHTEVPRATLLRALKADSDLHSTQELKGQLCMAVEIDLR